MHSIQWTIVIAAPPCIAVFVSVTPTIAAKSPLVKDAVASLITRIHSKYTWCALRCSFHVPYNCSIIITRTTSCIVFWERGGDVHAGCLSAPISWISETATGVTARCVYCAVHLFEGSCFGGRFGNCDIRLGDKNLRCSRVPGHHSALWQWSVEHWRC